MLPGLFTKETRVVVVEPSGSARKLMTDCLKPNGFDSLQSMDSLKNLIGFLEVEEADWIVMPLQKDDPVTGFHVLKIIRSQPTLRHLRVSLFVEDSERELLPFAFHLGALSWHSRVFTKDTVKKEFDVLKGRFQENKGDALATAVAYLHDTLRESGNFERLAHFYDGLSTAFGDVGTYQVRHAEALFDAGNVEKGREAIAHLRQRNVSGWEGVAARHLAKDDIPDGQFDLDSLLLVDPDEMIHRQVTEALAKKGVGTVHVARDGEEALALLVEKKPSFILQEWKLPKIGGAQFIQRVRHLGHASLPIVVVSSLPTKQDLALLSEMSVARVIPKPFDESLLLTAVDECLREVSDPRDAKSFERRFRETLAEGDMRRGLLFLRRLMTFKGATEAQKLLAKALFLYSQNANEKAAATLKAALKAGADPLQGVHLLGKILVRLGDYAGAVACFERAQELSPKNIERLCDIADAKAQLGDESGASASLDAAKAIDAGSSEITEKETKLALMRGDMNCARELLLNMGNLRIFVADMNNTAVAYIRSGRYDQGVTLYRRSLEAMPATQTEWRMKVGYNLALAFARKGDLAAAQETLANVPRDESLPVSRKITSLEDRIGKAIAKKGPLDLPAQESQNTTNTNATPWDVEAFDASSANDAALEASLAGMSCEGFILGFAGDDMALAKLVAGAPKFARREALAREDSMGVERMM
ncbi:MAG: response regulator [Silvanigrellales bacterium]|nr:response regulator [Silvanigrellales bacterium]